MSSLSFLCMKLIKEFRWFKDLCSEDFFPFENLSVFSYSDNTHIQYILKVNILM